MSNDHRSYPAGYIEALREAARVERAETLRRLLLRLLRRRSTAEASPPPSQAALGVCR